MASDRGTEIWGLIVFVGILLIFAVIVTILSPILIPYLLFLWLIEKNSERKYRRYLAENEGAKLFCYTNRHTSEKYVETMIVPFLAEDVRILKISDKGWINLQDEEGLQIRVARAMKTVGGGFPYISKIVNGKLTTESINNRLYSAITRKADAEFILKGIEKFYS